MPDRPDPADILGAALELPPGERSAYIERVCGDDQELSAELLSLISLHTRARNALGTDILGAQVEDHARQLREDMVGREVGAYRIVRLIDTGGMGAVYLGERSDAEYDKLVAIKLFRSSLGGHALLERFRLERQVLANLEHPNIARLLDGGALPDGVPYIIMEYVDGMPLDQHAATHRLSITDRLDLFRHVCDAIAYAHRNLIVHRDLKPANILVDRSGAPKVLDFGIAKVLGDDRSPPSATLTAQRMLTPRYASPEQVRGEATTTATDVYSLGVVLFELLTGSHPSGDRTGQAWELAQAISTGEPSRPSIVVSRSPDTADRIAAERRASPRAVTRRLKGDLDTIVLKALEKDPARRYGSVAELSEDIQRHLERQPVLARPRTLGYQLATFARRNKAVVGALVGLLFVLTAGLIATTSQYLRAEERSREARWQEYSARIAAAESAIRSNQIEAAERFLAEAPQSLRGWEWEHLHARLDGASHALAAHDHWVTALAFSPDGKTMASGSYDQSVKIWDLDPPALRHTLKREVVEHPSPVWTYGVLSLGFLADGRRLAVGYVSGFDYGKNEGGAAAIWDTESGVLLEYQDKHMTWAEVAVDTRRDRIAVGGFRGQVRVYRDGLKEVVARIEPPLDPGEEHRRVHDVAFHPVENRIVTVRSRIDVWDLANRSRLHGIPPMGDGFTRVCLAAGGERMAGVTRAGSVVVWDAGAGRPVTVFDGHDGTVHDLALDSSGSEAISVGSDARVLVWDPGTGVTRAELQGHRSAVRSIARSPDGHMLASGDELGEIRIWGHGAEGVPTFRTGQSWRPEWPIVALPTPDGSRILTGGTNRRVELWDRGERSTPRQLEELDVCGAAAMAMSSTGDVLLVANENGFVTLADYTRRKLTRVFPAHRDSVLDVAIHGEGRRFATIGSDSLLHVWNVADPPERLATVPLPGRPTAVAYLPEDGVLVSGDMSGRVLLHDAGGAVRQELVAHGGRVTDIAADPEGRGFATASEDGTVKLWRPGAREPAFTIVQARQRMNAVAFSEDGQRLFAGGKDGTIRVLDPRKGREIVRLHGHSDAVTSLASGTAGLLVSSARDGTARLWETRRRPPPAADSATVVEASGTSPSLPRTTAATGTPPVPEAWWSGDAGAEESMGGRHGSLRNGVDLAPGRVGNAFRFRGATGEVRVDDLPPSLRERQDFTVVLWVGPDADGPPAGTVLSHRPDWIPNARKSGWKLVATPERWWLGQESGGEAHAIVSDVAVAAGDFTHLAAVFDRGTGRATLYVNGKAQSQVLQELEEASWANDGAFRIGRAPWDEGYRFHPFRGLVDEVRVFGGALSPEEVRACYLRDAGG